jgi:hypothetical protein
MYSNNMAHDNSTAARGDARLARLAHVTQREQELAFIDVSSPVPEIARVFGRDARKKRQAHASVQTESRSSEVCALVDNLASLMTWKTLGIVICCVLVLVLLYFTSPSREEIERAVRNRELDMIKEKYTRWYNHCAQCLHWPIPNTFREYRWECRRTCNSTPWKGTEYYAGVDLQTQSLA